MNSAKFIYIGDEKIALDKQGHLIHFMDWNMAVALLIATQESRELNDSHFQLLEELRAFYRQFAHVPAMRAFSNWLKQRLGEPYSQSIYLAQLFPPREGLNESSLRIAARLAGLPPPDHCL